MYSGLHGDPPPLEQALGNRRWWSRRHPCPHFVVRDVFAPDFYAALEDEFRALLDRGFGPPSALDRFARNMPNSDAYSWNFTADVSGPLSIFYRRDWHDLIARLTGAETTLDVNGALHHHQPGSLDGQVHNDVGIGYFIDRPRPDGVNPMDLSRCSYTDGRPGALGDGRPVRAAVRSVAVLLYLCNPDWRPGDGGETGLFLHPDDPVKQPTAAVPPINNTLLVFEITPRSLHSFLHNPHKPRNSVVMWLHRSYDQAVARFGQDAIYEWTRKY